MLRLALLRLALLRTGHIARLPEGLVHQFRLAADHLLQLPHHAALLPILRVAAEHARRAQALHQVAELRQHLARGIAGAGAHQLADLLHHPLNVLALDDSHPRIEGHVLLGLLLVPKLLCQLPQIAVHRVFQLAHETLKLLVRRVLGQSLHQLPLDTPKLALGNRQLPVLDA